MQTGIEGRVDPSRIALWGTSYSGGHVIVAAAKKGKAIRAVTSQVRAPAPLLSLHPGLDRHCGLRSPHQCFWTALFVPLPLPLSFHRRVSPLYSFALMDAEPFAVLISVGCRFMSLLLLRLHLLLLCQHVKPCREPVFESRRACGDSYIGPARHDRRASLAHGSESALQWQQTLSKAFNVGALNLSNGTLFSPHHHGIW